MAREVIGYKVFDSNWKCRDQQYQLGQTYEMEEEPVPCQRGYHFCARLVDCFGYYPFDPKSKVARITALGLVEHEGNKSVTNKIRIDQELTWAEVLQLVNTGDKNEGLANTGDRNAGQWNAGDENTGSWNTGDRNAGDRNVGDGNVGDRNVGDGNAGDENTGSWNTGSWNTGDRNVGDRNVGDENTGSWNTGDRNAGDRNVGDGNTGSRNTGSRNTGSGNTGSRNTGSGNTGSRNTGSRNTGSWNTGSRNTGSLCTETPKQILFDKETDMTRAQWESTFAFELLCCLDDFDLDELDAAWKMWWEDLDNEEKKIIQEIPNFDAKKFQMITGIDVNNKDA